MEYRFSAADMVKTRDRFDYPLPGLELHILPDCP